MFNLSERAQQLEVIYKEDIPYLIFNIFDFNAMKLIWSELRLMLQR